MTAALRTTGLHKSFGSLVVAQDVAITLPQGARYALIGPNGAGKTTLINLITGALRPDAGQILLGEEEITALEPDRRVKRGLARTFQINTLFPDLEPLEAVTLAVCERLGVAASGGGALPGSATRSTRPTRSWPRSNSARSATARRASLPTASNGCWRSRWRWRRRPKVLLLDEPAAGVPRQEGGELFEAIANLSSDIAVLFIEHDMEVVFRFASRVIVMVGGRLLLEGSPAEIAADPRVREVYLGRSRHG